MKTFDELTPGSLAFRQGDVGFLKEAIPPDARPIPLRPFALGEVTGHSHRIAPGFEGMVEMLEKDGEIYGRIIGDVAVPVVHEDHDPTGSVSLLPPGFEGVVRIAREYDEEEDFRSVAD
jgi:hypothetical protein